MDSKARAKVVTFLILTTVLVAACYAPILSARSLRAEGGRWVFALMWSPGLAGLLTRLLWQRNLKGMGWGWGRTRFQVAAYLLAPAAALLVYGVVWLTGLGGLAPERLETAIAQSFGLGSISLPVAVLIAATVGVAASAVFAMGEELGWRGVLVPELAKLSGFTSTALWSGAIWALYHYPAILATDYHAATPRVFSMVAFTVSVFAAGVILAWVRLKSGSVWTGVIFHASHNLFVQDVFDRMTVSRGKTEYVTTEFGIGLAIVYAAIAFALWRRRGELGAAVTAPVSTPGAAALATEPAPTHDVVESAAANPRSG